MALVDIGEAPSVIARDVDPFDVASIQCMHGGHVVRVPGIGLDIDNPVDLRAFMRSPVSARTRTRAMLDRLGL